MCNDHSINTFLCNPCGEYHDIKENESESRNRCKAYVAYNAHRRSHPETKITLKEYRQGRRECKNPKLTTRKVFIDLGFFQCFRCNDLFDLSFRNGSKKSICKLCESYEKHIKNSDSSIEFDEFKDDFYERFELIKLQPIDKGKFFCIGCNQEHDKSLRKRRHFLCVDRFNYMEYINRNGVDICFDDYIKEISKINVQKYRLEKISKGMFTCIKCKKDRKISFKRKNCFVCRICSYYEAHKNNFSYDEYEEIYIKRNMIKDGKAKRCRLCLDIKENKLFKASSFCLDCWNHPDAKKISQLRGILGGFMSKYKSEIKFKGAFGYSKHDLMQHLESMFTDGMTRELLINGDIHIDHIIPVTAFDHKNPTHLSYCWSLKNLQPLWAKDNISKSDKLSNGIRVRDIRAMPNGRERLDKLLKELYGFDA